MTTWTDLSDAFGYGTKLTSTQMQQLRDNITAFTEKASGAPVLADDYVVAAMLADSGIDSADKFVAGVVDQTAIGASAVGQGELKTTTSEVSVVVASIGTTYYTAAIGGGNYGFVGEVKKNSSAYTTNFTGFAYGNIVSNVYNNLKAGFERTDGTTSTAYYRCTYVQASGELHWIFLLMKNGEVIATWEQPDHPSFGRYHMDHPFDFPFNGIEQKDCDIILVIPSINDIEAIRLASIPSIDGGWFTKEKLAANIGVDYSRDVRSFVDVFLDNYNIDESKEDLWPDTPVTVALPRIYKGSVVDDWRLMPQWILNEKTGLMERIKVKPVQRVIQKADNITMLKYKKRININGIVE